ncbi:MAG: protein kinase domain-containing protein [Chloroflexota bacterium]|nr:MAG: hypothetical protein DLM70_06280 [Chloroflexota bacterium]
MLEPDTVLNGRYRLQEPLGEGGMAIVYRAVDARLGRTVAVKVLSSQYARDEPFLARFQQEAEFAASLGSHPNIVAIYDVGQDDASHYIVMELVEGRNLKELIRERTAFSVDEAFSIGRQVASALDFAHKRGLIHRDIKPQNILVTPEGVAKVTDFGIAQSASATQLTRAGMVIGTVHYFSPEQAQGKTAGPSSDIYSLGVILYEMLTGHLPFDAETPIGVAMQHLHSTPPSPWDYRPDLPAPAVSIVMRALEKDPANRYRDAAELAAALSSVPGPSAGGTTTLNPIVTPPPQRTSVYRAVEPPARHVEEEPRRRRSAAVEAPARSRLPWIALGLAALIAAVIFGSLFATGRIFAVTPATATATTTPTSTATPKPKKKRATVTPTIPVFVPPPAATSTPPPLPTFTPVPPTLTPTPTVPAATPTPTPAAPTPTPTPQGATPTPTPFG